MLNRRKLFAALAVSPVVAVSAAKSELVPVAVKIKPEGQGLTFEQVREIARQLTIFQRDGGRVVAVDR